MAAVLRRPLLYVFTLVLALTLAYVFDVEEGLSSANLLVAFVICAAATATYQLLRK